MFESLSKFMDILFADGTLFEYIGYAAAIGTIAAFVIQSLRILATKNISGLSRLLSAIALNLPFGVLLLFFRKISLCDLRIVFELWKINCVCVLTNAS